MLNKGHTVQDYWSAGEAARVLNPKGEVIYP